MLQPPDGFRVSSLHADLGDQVLTMPRPDLLPPPPAPRSHLVTRAATPEQLQEAVRQLQLDLQEAGRQIGELQGRVQDLEHPFRTAYHRLATWLHTRWLHLRDR